MRPASFTPRRLATVMSTTKMSPSRTRLFTRPLKAGMEMMAATPAELDTRRAEGGDEEDFLGRVGRGRDGVRREDRQRDHLRYPLVLLFRRGQRAAHEEPLHRRQHGCAQ